jgi:UDP-N-acetyl-D-mannosaminuronic acid dehydrogenase
MSQTYDVAIIGGFGHVGLPLGIVLADAGFRVALYDTNTRLAPLIEAGTMPFIEHDAGPLLKRTIGKTLFVSKSLADAAQAKKIIITIGTPVDEYLSPKTRPLFELADALAPHLTSDHCLVLRSTVFPGTTASLEAYLATKGVHTHVAFCPERIVQGFAIRELRELPQVIAGTTKEAVVKAKELFTVLQVETIETTPEEAEMAKLFLNAWRYIQFATGNQFFIMATERSLNYDNIYRAMTHHYKRGNIPGPGFAAGPCLLKDTMQLAASYESRFPLGYAAMMINESLPDFVIRQAQKAMGDLRGRTIGILGMSFKADIDDPRGSLSYKLRKLLEFHGAKTLCSDEHIQDPSFISRATLLQDAELIIVGVPHSAYKQLIVPAKTHVIDLWGCLPDQSHHGDIVTAPSPGASQ